MIRVSFASPILGIFAFAALPLIALEPAWAAPDSVPIPVVSVVEVAPREIVDRAVISGTLVARDEVLVAPEIDGLRVTDVLVEEGDRVEKGQILARLSREMLDTQIAQNTATIARAQAAIAQGHDGIDQADASAQEAMLALNRAKTLIQSGNFTEATLEQRVSASRSANGRLAAAKNGLSIAEADLALAKAQREDLMLRAARTEIRAPVDGIISRKAARIGATASTSGEALFHLIAHGRIELEGEVTESALGKLKVGAPAIVTVDGSTTVTGHVRAIYPEIDRTSRLGKVRVKLDANAGLHAGAFARGAVEVARHTGSAVPVASLLYGSDDSVSVLLVRDGRVAEHKVEPGLSAGGFVEITSGLATGDVIVARAGPFLRTGDAVRIADAAAGAQTPR
jgi:RND family efflux transporter MFP subunit